MAEIKGIYFFQPHYPEFATGGELFQNKVYEYFKSERPDVFTVGSAACNKSKFKKIISGIKIFIKLRGGAVLVCTNNECLHFYIPVILRKLFFHRVKIFLIVHHLIQSLSGKYLLNNLESSFIRKSDFMITISEATKSELVSRNLASEDTYIVNPGTDIKPAAANRNLTQILFTGNIEERKGLHFLIEALGKSGRNDFLLIAAGDYGNDKKYFHKLNLIIADYNLNERIVFKGKVSYEELVRLYSESGIFVFPSQVEGYGLALIEAMKCGLAIIASDIPSTREIITDGVDGLLYEKNNPAELSKKLDLLLTNESMRNALAANSLKKSESFNTWNDTCSKVYKLFTEVIK